jgi:hypothetical protein
MRVKPDRYCIRVVVVDDRAGIDSDGGANKDVKRPKARAGARELVLTSNFQWSM